MAIETETLSAQLRISANWAFVCALPKAAVDMTTGKGCALRTSAAQETESINHAMPSGCVAFCPSLKIMMYFPLVIKDVNSQEQSLQSNAHAFPARRRNCKGSGSCLAF
jgi:hypothetical protein